METKTPTQFKVGQSILVHTQSQQIGGRYVGKAVLHNIVEPNNPFVDGSDEEMLEVLYLATGNMETVLARNCIPLKIIPKKERKKEPTRPPEYITFTNGGGFQEDIDRIWTTEDIDRIWTTPVPTNTPGRANDFTHEEVPTQGLNTL